MRSAEDDLAARVASTEAVLASLAQSVANIESSLASLASAVSGVARSPVLGNSAFRCLHATRALSAVRPAIIKRTVVLWSSSVLAMAEPT